jgi:ATP adenylyltransferase
MARASRPARLWAPWRMSYVGAANEPAGCLFCRVARARSDRRHLVVARGERAFVLLNRFPYNPGHLMVAVAAHRPQFSRLTAAERYEVFEFVALAERALQAEYRPHGLNVGVNLGRVAGAGFPGHLHVHLVPRWDGDTNFMPVVGETKVLPESLGSTWTRLRRAFRAAAAAEHGGARR